MWSEVERYLNLTAIVRTIVLSALAAACGAAVGYRWRGPSAATRTAGWILFVGSVAAIVVVTFAGAAFGDFSASTFQLGNWTPFKTITGQLFHHTNPALGLANVVGNIALFAPTGLLAALLLPSWWQALGMTPVLSTLIEITQQFTGRSGDIDDIILNTVGGTIGVLIGLAILRYRHAKTGQLTDGKPTR